VLAGWQPFIVLEARNKRNGAHVNFRQPLRPFIRLSDRPTFTHEDSGVEGLCAVKLVRHRIGQSIAPVGARRQHHADQRGEQLATHEITGRGKSRAEAALWPRPLHCDGTAREKVGMHHLLVVMRESVFRERSRSVLVPRAFVHSNINAESLNTQKGGRD
jgi:hypothetical protein